MADGSIRVVTKLDNSKLKQQIKELERELKNIQKEQAKVDAQVDGVMAKYQAEREFDSQFPEEFSHRQDIDKRAAQELDPIIAKQEALNQKEQQYLQMLDAAKAKLAEQAQIADASKRVDDSVKADAMGKVQSQAQYNSLLDATAAKMAAIEAAAAREAAQRGLSTEQILSANNQYQKLSDTMGMLKTKAGDFDASMKRAAKSTKKVGTGVKRGIAGFGKMQLIIMGIMMATRAISAATQEYMATNSTLAGQINTLKSLWGQVLGPVIEWVTNLLIKAISAINAFVYALTGINFIAKANAAALNKQAKATGALKAQLAGFDEQTKLADSSGGNVDPVTLLDESVDVLPKEMSKALEDGDFYESGRIVGEALAKGIGDFSWGDLGEKIGKFLGDAVAFILGFVLQLKPDVIIASIHSFVGKLLSGLADALQNINWIQFGEDVADFLWSAIMVLALPNFDDVLAGVMELLGTILSALAQALPAILFRFATLLLEAWDAIKGYFDDYVDWGGTPWEIMQGLWDGMKAALPSVKDWIMDNIWEPFKQGFVDCIAWDDPTMQLIAGLWEGIKHAWKTRSYWFESVWESFVLLFKDFFGIHGPSKKMAGFGGDIIAGLFQGITNGISKIKTACETIWLTIKGVFSSVGSWFQTTFSNAWQKVKDVFSTGGKIFDGIKEGISSTFKTIVNGLIDGINRVIRVPFNAINGMLNTIRGTEVLGFTPFKGLWSYNPLSIPQIPKLALGGIVNRPGRGVPAIIGEAGAEAVLPLENNTEWMDILADKIGGGTITIPINLDGKRIATYVVDIQKKKAFAMNGA